MHEWSYTERENMIILMGLVWGEPWGGMRGQKNLQSEKYWDIVSVHEDNKTQCTVSYWTIGEQGDRERVSNGGGNLIKAPYMHIWNTEAKPLWTNDICLKNEGKESKIGPGYQRMAEGIRRRWRRTIMVDVFLYSCMKIEQCWNCSKNCWEGMRENDGGG
jgi:hypothetical protein